MGMFDNGGYLANPDPLGIGAAQRGRDRRQKMQNEGMPLSMLGLGISPEWDGFFEGMRGKRMVEGTPFNESGSIQNAGQLSNQIGSAGQGGDAIRSLLRKGRK